MGMGTDDNTQDETMGTRQSTKSSNSSLKRTDTTNLMNKVFAADAADEDEGETVQSIPWILTVKADFFFGAWISLNAVCMAIETDYRTPENDSHGVWIVMDSLFNVVFLVELCMRAFAMRSLWFREVWNILDFLMVSIGVVDSWLIPLLAMMDGDGDSGGESLRFVTMLRLFRMLKLARVFRLIKLVTFLKELRLLCRGMVTAFRATMWGFIMLGLIIFVCALLTTKLVGKQCCDEDDFFSAKMLPDYFGTLPRSAFTLFQFTMEFQPDMVRETWEDGQILTIFLLCYTTLTNIMLLNMLASVIVDSILMISLEESKHGEEERLDKAREVYMGQLLELFKEFDTDGNGEITVQEFTDTQDFEQRVEAVASSSTSGGKPRRMSMMPSSNQFDRKMTAEGQRHERRKVALKAVGITTRQAVELSKVLDGDGSGTISKEEFVRGFERVRGPAQSKHVLKVECQLESVVRKMEKMHIELVRNITESLMRTARSHDGRPLKEESYRLIDSTREESYIESAKPDSTGLTSPLRPRPKVFDFDNGFADVDADEGKVPKLPSVSSNALPKAYETFNGVRLNLAIDEINAHNMKELGAQADAIRQRKSPTGIYKHSAPEKSPPGDLTQGLEGVRSISVTSPIPSPMHGRSGWAQGPTTCSRLERDGVEGYDVMASGLLSPLRQRSPGGPFRDPGDIATMAHPMPAPPRPTPML